MVYVTGQDALDAPFGAMMHLDWIEIKRNTPAFRAAQRALVCTDEITSFLGGFPSNFKNKEAVIEFVHRFDNVPPEIRRWWSDCAPEFRAAARTIQRQRPLAHFTSIPWRHAPRAEKSNRTVTEGARTVLIQSGLNEAWWPLAMLHWIAMWNGFVVGEDGRTPYHRRFREHAPYRQYPFGALVLLHPHRPVQPLRSEPVHEKLHSRLVPATVSYTHLTLPTTYSV